MGKRYQNPRRKARRDNSLEIAVAERMREVRTLRKLSQRQVASMGGPSTTAQSSVNNALNSAQLSTMQELARIFNVRLSTFFLKKRGGNALDAVLREIYQMDNDKLAVLRAKLEGTNGG